VVGTAPHVRLSSLALANILVKDKLEISNGAVLEKGRLISEVPSCSEVADKSEA